MQGYLHSLLKYYSFSYNICVVKVLLFGEAKRILCRDSIQIEFKGSLKALKEELAMKYPEISPVLNISAFAVNKEYKKLEYELKGDETVAVIPPVGGG